MKVPTNRTPMYLSEELLGANPVNIEITLYTGRLPKMSPVRYKELFGSVKVFLKVYTALIINKDVFVTNEHVHILHDEGLECIPKTQ